MSLLFEKAVAAFDADSASLAARGDVGSSDAAFDVPTTTVTEFAAAHAELAHPDRDEWTRIPLHEPDSAALTGEYVVYSEGLTDEGMFVYYDADADSRKRISREAFEESSLCAQIRFWHSDFVPEERPAYYDSPIQSPVEPSRTVDGDRFFGDLRSHVAAERERAREERERRARDATPTEWCDSGGDGIPTLKRTGTNPDGEYEFAVAGDCIPEGEWSIRDTFGVYEGNEVLLHPPNAETAPGSFPLRATVAEIRGRRLRLSVAWESVEDRASVGSFLAPKRHGYGAVLLLNPVPFDREREAIDDVESRSSLADALTGRRRLTFGSDRAATSSTHDVELNQEQQEAVEHALLADDVCCIHGPPGTGKTRTLVEIVRRAAQSGRSVLVCADSNQAVDNLVVGSSTESEADERSLHAYAQHGAEEFVLARRNYRRSSRSLVRDAYGTTRPEDADVVASTNGSAAALPPRFDLVVMDEATQATCTSACVPLSRGETLVLAGDHRQLPPYSASESPPESAGGLSIFEHVYAEGGVYEGVGVQLRTQYRMHRDVVHFPNRRFYGRTLRNGRDVSAVAGLDALRGFHVVGEERRAGNSYVNETEARLVTHLASEVVAEESNGVGPADIGVITPYSAQVDAIRDSLREHVSGGERITVDTVDSFQGSERDAVFLSLVRSNEAGRVGFMGRRPDGPRRLNVALTRAGKHCSVVANWNVFRGRDADHECTDLYDDFHSFLDDTGRLKRVEPEFIPV
ncbi:AAA domain-containing protein [Halopelagius longus]|uniref:AAA domain-containing protein n=1 Tax=Halopelagius longus TaxID=1236180 RepID=A0A1H1G952_9EURY|nr:AAA domain-containing protein [Halopelagius longus]RDI69771.1 DNA-binding protein [Halopelagius longus]SDR09625.1 AAA domain-containing protein [Halopelagius longus]